MNRILAVILAACACPTVALSDDDTRLQAEVLAVSKRIDALIVTGTTYKNAAERVHSLYMWVLSRPPRPEESQMMAGYIDRAGANEARTRALEEVYWKLLNSGDFLLNH